MYVLAFTIAAKDILIIAHIWAARTTTIKKINKQRKDYYEYYTDKQWAHSESYDLCINSKIGIEACVDILEAAIKTKFNLK